MQGIAAEKLTARVEGLFVADGSQFRSREVDRIELGFAGIEGDRHGGLTRESGSDEPWYERGTEIFNNRQVSILGVEELAEIAARLNIDALRPDWIVANIVLSGIARLTSLPPRTSICFAGGATVRVDGDNAPCRFAGKSIAENFPGREDIELGFVKAAAGRRGLVGWVERPGVVEVGEAVIVRVPAQLAWPAEGG